MGVNQLEVERGREQLWLLPYLEPLNAFESGHLLDCISGNQGAQMALLDRLQKGLYFVTLALYLELNPAVDQVLDPTSDFVALRNFLDAKSEAHPLNPAFVKDALRNHRSFEFRVLQGQTSTNTAESLDSAAVFGGT